MDMVIVKLADAEADCSKAYLLGECDGTSLLLIPPTHEHESWCFLFAGQNQDGVYVDYGIDPSLCDSYMNAERSEIKNICNKLKQAIKAEAMEAY